LLSGELAMIHVATHTAVIADVHLGYEWARAARGDLLPAHTLDETLTRLEALTNQAPLKRLVVAGDLVESSRPCIQTAREVEAMKNWLDERGIALVVLRGNHDPVAQPPNLESFTLDGWTICHGDKPLAARRLIIGHHHPVISLHKVVAPCFLLSDACVVLPAASANAAGINVLSGPLPGRMGKEKFRCIAALEGRLFDFGGLHELAIKTRSLSSGR
jgi:putative SbcD/Mre11-related phosphoesterase